MCPSLRTMDSGKIKMKNSILILLTFIMGPRGMVDVQPYQNGFIIMDLNTGKNTLVTRQQDGVMILPEDGKGEFIDTIKPLSIPLNFDDPRLDLEQQ